MNNKTILLEHYVDYVEESLFELANLVNTTTRQNTYFKINIIFFTFIIFLFSFFLLSKYPNE